MESVGLTAAQLVSLSCSEARTPGFKVQGGQYLNTLLLSLAYDYDFDIIRETTQIIGQNVGSTVLAGPGSLPGFALPSDCLRTREAFYNVQGAIFWMTKYNDNLADIDKEYQGPGVANYPTKYATDVSPNPSVIYFYPPFSVPTTVFVRYQPIPAQIPNAETSATIPWFPHQRALKKLLTADLCDLARDPRGSKLRVEGEEMLRGYLAMSDDKEGRSKRIPLDPNSFRVTYNAKNTKLISP